MTIIVYFFVLFLRNFRCFLSLVIVIVSINFGKIARGNDTRGKRDNGNAKHRGNHRYHPSDGRDGIDVTVAYGGQRNRCIFNNFKDKVGGILFFDMTIL